MSNARFFATATLTAVVFAAVAAGLLVPSARAAAPIQVNCKATFAALGPSQYEKFVSENLAAGRTTIFAPNDGVVCAW